MEGQLLVYSLVTQSHSAPEVCNLRKTYQPSSDSGNVLESEYRDRLELKSSGDRTLGVGVNLSTNFLLILTATNMMKVSLDLDKIKAFRPELVTVSFS